MSTAPAHAERAHALLSASKAEQWLNCPPSARLQEGVPDSRSAYADEGTAAHEYAELRMRRYLLPCNAAQRRELDEKIETFQRSSAYFGPEMEGCVQDYVDFVEERFMAAKARSADAVLLLESLADFSDWVPEGKGTNDVVIVADGMMDVIDLKYGKGVPVSAIGNPQIRLYALGAWAEHSLYYDIQDVHLSIVQPRLDSITTDVMPIDELVDWAASVVRPAAALAWEGAGEHRPGEHCRWCKVKAKCRARADANMTALAYEFQDPALMTLDEIGAILHVAQQLKTWAGDIEDYAFEQAKTGQHVPGWKLVEGRSSRAITDAGALQTKLTESGFTADQITETKLLGITKLEAVVTKKKLAALAGDLIMKPPGKPVLVAETDPRAELNSIEQDFENIDMED